MEGWLLQNQSIHTKWTKILHTPHVGSAADSVRMSFLTVLFTFHVLLKDHSLGYSEQCDHEHLARVPVQGVHHQEAGERRHGDCCLHPEHPGGESGGGAVHLHQPNQQCYKQLHH